jgi:predicted GNAT family N-acyltransferase
MILDVSCLKRTKYLHAQVQVVEFYEKVGFKKIGEKFDEVGIMHYQMILE